MLLILDDGSILDLKLEIGFASNPNTALASTTWTDVSNYVLSASTKRGRQFELDRFDAGTAQVELDNTDRRFEPGYGASPYYPNVVPTRRARISVGPYGGTLTPVFTGYIRSWQPSWQMNWATITVNLVDAFALLQTAELVGSFASAASGTRVGDVLNAISFPAADRVIDAGVATLSAESYAAGGGQSALAHLQDVMDTELGQLFIDAQGRVVFQDRNKRRGSPYTTSQATFTDQWVKGTTYPWGALQTSYDDQHIYNDIQVSRSGGTTQTATDSTSQTKYGVRTLSRNTKASTDLQNADIANGLLLRFKNPSLRIDRIDIETWLDGPVTGLFNVIVARDISDRLTVEVHPPNTGGDTAAVSAAVHVESIEWSWDPASDAVATTSLQLSPVDPTTFWILDTSTLETPAATAAVLGF